MSRIRRSFFFNRRLHLWFHILYSNWISWTPCFNWYNFFICLFNTKFKTTIFFLSPFWFWSGSMILTFCRCSMIISLSFYLLIWKLNINSNFIGFFFNNTKNYPNIYFYFPIKKNFKLTRKICPIWMWLRFFYIFTNTIFNTIFFNCYYFHYFWRRNRSYFTFNSNNF